MGGPSSALLDAKDEEALRRVDQATAMIEGLVNGTIDVSEVDKVTDNFITESAQRLQDEQEEKRFKLAQKNKDLKGREGKGRGINYKWFCKGCFIEYKIDLEDNKCTKCGSADRMLTNKERNDDILAQAEVLQEAKNHRKQRRERFEVYKKQKMLEIKKNGGTDYNKWDSWEPESDDSDLDPILPNGPEFKALERDFEVRAGKLKEKRRIANVFKLEGNKAFGEGNLQVALNRYNDAFGQRKDDKAIYTNRALVYYKMKRYREAIKDCTAVVDMWEWMDDKIPFKGLSLSLPPSLSHTHTLFLFICYLIGLKYSSVCIYIYLSAQVMS